MNRGAEGRKSGGEEIVGGVTLVSVFGLLFLSTHHWFWLFPLCFAGLPALLRGVQRVYSQRALIRRRRAEAPRDAEAEGTRQILRIAKDNHGKVTPALITLNSALTLEEADRLLQSMSSKGYAAMNVTDSGRIEYEFPEFADRLDEIE